jgi:hypothetical protein
MSWRLYPWKWSSLLKTFFPIILAAGYIVGLYYASYDWEDREVNGYMLAFLILASIIAAYLFLQIFWWFKRRRSRGSPSRIYKVMALRKDDLVDEKAVLIQEQILPILERNEAQNVRITDDLFPRIIFDFPENHQYNYLNQVSIEVISHDQIILRAVLRVEYPISLSIKRGSKKKEAEEYLENIQSSEYYHFYSTHQVLYEEILVKEEIDKLLVAMIDNLELISFNGRFILGKFEHSKQISNFLVLANLVHDVVMLKDFSDVEIENLICYECGDPFETGEDICTHCNAPRPTCIICLLDLKLSEKKIVVQTPCCNVYTHRDHMITWLEKDTKCPNCKKDQFLWLRKLKQES